MNNRDIEALKELKEFINKENEKLVNEVKDISEKVEIKEEKIQEQKVDESVPIQVFDKLNDVLDRMYGTISEDRKEYIEKIVEIILSRIEEQKEQKINEAIERIPKPKDGKNGQSIKFLGSKFKHPTNPKQGQFYRNETNKSVYIYDGDDWKVLVRDGIGGASGGGVSRKEIVGVITANAVTSVFGETNVVEQINSAAFDPNYTSAGNPQHQEGLLFYDFENKTLSMYNDQSDVSLQLGQETHIRVVNKTGSTITNGKVVYITGSQGNRPTIEVVSASSTDIHVAGMTTHDILDNQEGLITINGTLAELDTSDFIEGDFLYVSTSGTLTTTPPQAPIQQIEVGTVLISHQNNGKIELQLGESHPIEELSNVNGTPAVQGSLLEYDVINGYWDATSNTSAFHPRFNVVSVSADYTASINDVVLADTSTSSFAITIPSASAVGKDNRVDVKKKRNSANLLTVSAVNGNIDENEYIQLGNGYPSVTFISDGTNWWII